LSALLQAAVITLREGLEAFLIVAISLAYLRKRGRHNLVGAVQWGIAAALGVSGVGGYLLYRASDQGWLEGPLALIAAASVMWMIIHMWRVGRYMKGDIETRLQSSSGRPGTGAFTGVFLFTLFMVSREGVETALLLFQLHETIYLVVGAAVGIVCAAGVAYMWSRYGHRVNLSLFFQATAIFLFVFVAQLVIQGFHESAEQHLLPYSAVIHERTEAWGPDSAFGHLLTYLLVILPLGWLAFKALFSKRPVLLPKPAAPPSGEPEARGSATR
jgi:high-affinity iron transporter